MDLQVRETGNGGDLNLVNNDLQVVDSFENMVYLGMFGGNTEASTSPRLITEQGFDYWANTLVYPNAPGLQFNSRTERTLNEVSLNSSGRLKIEQAVKSDLSFMESFAEVSVSVSVVSNDRVSIDVKLKRLDNLQERQYIYIWEAGEVKFIES